jgi:signal transduction histidine kinase
MGYVNILRSFSELKENPTLNELMEGILKGANRMREVVNLMLDITRIDNETLKVARTLVPVKRIVDDLVREFATAAAERRIQLIVAHHPALPNLNADPSLLQKALYHLIINAIKYTPDGGEITLKTRPTSLAPGIPGVEIRVQDTGIGLDAEHHQLVFEKFYQVGDVAIHSSGKTTFKGGGPGLGLAIVRGVVRAHGGKVWVESPGHDETRFPGSTFILQLPIGGGQV